ncbi:MAG TPA: hypothetical protein VFS43_47810 [Polyangiaceae bacterium]|nr:hypothetical protein [Polyangiaceae bacterium]
MRGFLQPAFKRLPTENQTQFAKLSRHRRAGIAEAAKTTLVKAAQWSRGEAVPPAVAGALDAQVTALLAKRKG